MHPTNRTIDAGAFFVLRTPLLPVDDLVDLSADLTARAAFENGDDLDAALQHDRNELRRRLRVIVGRPEVREAVFIASPSLEQSIAHWLNAPSSERGRKIERAFLRYFCRMATRPTPFGLFAGFSVGEVGSHSAIELAPLREYRRHSRLDSDYLTSLCESLSADHRLREVIIWRTNSSVYSIGGELRYVEVRRGESGRKHYLVASETTPELSSTLAGAKNGATLGALADALTASGSAPDEAESFIQELADAQLLVPELQPLLTGGEPLTDLVSQLNHHATSNEYSRLAAAQIERAHAALIEIDSSPLGMSPEKYRRVAHALEAFPIPLDVSRLFQVDLFKPTRAAILGREVIDEVTSCISQLRRISPRESRSDDLTRFREAFQRRYEYRRVPITEALDDELGVGFGSTTRNISLFSGPPLERFRQEPTSPTRGRGLPTLFAKFAESIAQRNMELVLDRTTLDGLADDSDWQAPLPDALSALVTVISASEEALSKGDFRLILRGVDGPSGANLLGRFCHASPPLLAKVRAYLREEEEQNKEAIYAEIVHLPAGRIGNVLLRPLMREWEIPYLGRSGAASDRQLDLADLEVSVNQDRVLLHSRRLGREVIPRLGSAHAYDHPKNIPVYRFLCSLQTQNLSQVGFTWGPLENSPFLPRVRLGRTIVSLARWRLTETDVERILSAPNQAETFRRIQRLREDLRLPRWIATADSDNVLPVDLENVLSVDSFTHSLRNAGSTRLLEWIDFDDAFVRGPEGRFTHELVLPLLANQSRVSARSITTALAPDSPSTTGASMPSVDRVLTPGSDWLYFKVYTGPIAADRLLRTLLHRHLAEFRKNGLIDDWFFIRYADPEWHLRIRCHGRPDRLIGQVLPRIHSLLAKPLSENLLHKIQIDTYQREIERYGGPAGMLWSERLFCVDSERVLQMLRFSKGTARWQIALKGIDDLLEGFGLTLEERIAIVLSSRDAVGRNTTLDYARVGSLYREHRVGIESLLAGSEPTAPNYSAAFRCLANSRERLIGIAEELRAQSKAGALSCPLSEVLRAYLHMHINRVALAASPVDEQTVYDFLARVYEGRLARR